MSSELNQAIGNFLAHALPEDTPFVALYRAPGEGKTSVVSTMLPDELVSFLLTVAMSAAGIEGGELEAGEITVHVSDETH